MSSNQQGGIQADADKTNPAWIHSGEPGTTGREPFEEDKTASDGTGLLHGQHGQHGHHGHHGQSGGQGLTGATGAGYDNNDRSGFASGTGTGYDNNDRSGDRRDIAGAGLAGATAGTGHHHHQHGQHGVSNETLGRSGVTGERGYDNNNLGSGQGLKNSDDVRGVGSGNTGLGAGATQSGFKDFDNEPSFDGNRVGDQNQSGGLYERTGDRGPATSGAAGTDRFDTDKHRHTGVTGTQGRDVGTGAHRGVGDVSEDSAYARTGGGELGASSGRGGSAGTNNGPTTGTGGALSGLTTTDDEFTGKNRSHTGPNVGTAGGAYEDTSGTFQSNTSGPGGNSALTGREGTTSKNPVAQTTGSHSGTGTGTTEAEPEHKGFVQKIKDML